MYTGIEPTGVTFSSTVMSSEFKTLEIEYALCLRTFQLPHKLQARSAQGCSGHVVEDHNQAPKSNF